MQKLVGFSLIIATLSLTGLVFGQVYSTAEIGAQGMGGNGAYVARAEDNTALFYNPAGLARLEFNEFSVQASPYFSKSFYSNPGLSTWDADNTFDGLYNIFANWSFGERVAIGFGSATTHNMDVGWDDADFPGRFLSTGSRFRMQEHMAGLAFRLSDNFSFGANVRLGQAEYETSSLRPRPLDDQNRALFYEMNETIDTDGDGTGYSVGLLYRSSRRFAIGATYQSAMDLSLDGTRNFNLATRADDVRAQERSAALFANSGAAIDWTIPARYQIGLMSKVTVRTRLEVDVALTQWSDMTQLNIATQDVAGNPETLVIPRNWDDTLEYRIAGDFQQKRALLWTIGLAAIDRAAPDSTLSPEFPDARRFQYSFGVSYTWRDKFVLEAAWLYTQYQDRDTEGQEVFFIDNPPNYLRDNGQGGLYETQRMRFTFGVRMRFGIPFRRLN